MIDKPTIDNIFETARIEEVVSEFVTLKKRGANLLGLCPFHNEKTPSFTVSPSKGIYKCFGCGAGGNSVNFVMEHEHYSYPEALRYLAKKYNIDINEDEPTPQQIEEQTEKESLFIVTGFAQKYYSETLTNTDEGKAIGWSYLRERGFREDIIEKFQLGYSLEEYDGFSKTALAKGYQLSFLEKTGLTITKEDKQYDRFRGRVIFPIHNLSGKVIAFGGRTLRTDKKAAKYVNSPESDIYHKSNVLYGMFFAKKAIISENSCFLVEGYTDVISMYQSGVENVVASSGTSLTVEQIRLIKRYTNTITILYDGDTAGIKASFRGIDMILEEGMNVKIVLFPDGEDPDSLARKSTSEELKTFITSQAKDFIVFKTNLLVEEAANDPIKKTALIREIVTSIALIADPISRSVYTKECSTALTIDEQVLIHELNKQRRSNLQIKLKREDPRREAYLPKEAISSPEQIDNTFDLLHQEKEIINKLLHYADKTITVETTDEEDKTIETTASVASFIVSEIQKDNLNFINSLYQLIFDEYANALEKDEIIPGQSFVQHADNNIQQLAIDLLSTRYELHNWEKRHIFVTTEDVNLTKTIKKQIYDFKKKKLVLMKLTIQEQIKKLPQGDNKYEELMQQQVLIDKAISEFAKVLGHVIIK